MIHFDLPPETLRYYGVGPLAPYVEGFAALVSQQGYCLQVVQRKVSRVAALSLWLERRHIKLKQLQENHLEAFLKERWKRFSFRDGDQLTMTALLQHLRQSHAIPVPVPAPLNPADLLVQEYGNFLIQEKGLVQVSVKDRLQAVSAGGQNQPGVGESKPAILR